MKKIVPFGPRVLRAMTMVEIIVVLVILGFLALFALPRMLGADALGADQRAKTSVSGALDTASTAYAERVSAQPWDFERLQKDYETLVNGGVVYQDDNNNLQGWRYIEKAPSPAQDISVTSGIENGQDNKYLSWSNANNSPVRQYLESKERIKYNPNVTYKVTFRVNARFAGTTYSSWKLGLQARDDLGQVISTTGTKNDVSSPHLIVSHNTYATVNNSFVEYTGYVRGTAPTGTATASPSAGAPGKLVAGTATISPVFMFNGDNIARTNIYRLDKVTIEQLPEASASTIDPGSLERWPTEPDVNAKTLQPLNPDVRLTTNSTTPSRDQDHVSVGSFLHGSTPSSAYWAIGVAAYAPAQNGDGGTCWYGQRALDGPSDVPSEIFYTVEFDSYNSDDSLSSPDRDQCTGKIAAQLSYQQLKPSSAGAPTQELREGVSPNAPLMLSTDDIIDQAR